MKTTKYGTTLAGISLLALALASCASTVEVAPSPSPSESSGQHSHDDQHHEDHDHDHAHDHDQATAVEQDTATGRLVLTYDGGLLVLDALKGDIAADIPLAGFNRINPAGDGRHVLVSTSGGWQLLDAATWTQGHGDHNHYYTATPQLHDLLINADTPGHVVTNDGLTALFDDGTGQILVFAADGWTAAAEHGATEEVRSFTATAHHGVAVAWQDGTLLTTLDGESGRIGAQVFDGSGTELGSTSACPGVHGETVAAGNTAVLGCEDGVILLHGDHFHKIAAPDAYGRTGNLFAASGSDVVLGDYKTDPDGVLSQIALIDTAAEALRVVEVNTNYTFRGLARGSEGELLILGTDGNLQVRDEKTGELVRSVPVISPWDLPAEWQSPQPALIVLDGMAYVTDPATQQVQVVDYVGGQVWRTFSLPQIPNEIVGVTG